MNCFQKKSTHYLHQLRSHFTELSNRTLILLLIIFLLDTSCTTENQVERPRDPFIFRSVLDQRPRMVTLALHENLYVAYDARNANLYKAWDGHVNFEGAVYNTVHGPQPTSEGYSYYSQIAEISDWQGEKEGKKVTPEIQYKGHTYEKGRGSILFDLKFPDGTVVSVEESPEAQISGDKIGLERQFKLKGEFNGWQIRLPLKFTSMSSESDFETEGSFLATGKSEETVGGTTVYQASGNLSFSGEGESKVTVWYIHPEITSNEHSPELNESIYEKGKTLVNGNDCKTCHNESVKTVGPSYETIAKKYPYNQDYVSLLANKVIKGGKGSFGEVMMTAHPDLSKEDAETMLHYILSLDGETMIERTRTSSFKSTPKAIMELSEEKKEFEGTQQGLAVNVYKMDGLDYLYEELTEAFQPVLTGSTSFIHLPSTGDFEGYRRLFYMEFKGMVSVEEEKNYQFRLISDDGSRLYINGELIIDHGGLHGATPKDGDVILKKGTNEIIVQYFQGGGAAGVSLEWAKSDGSFEVVPEEAFSHKSTDLETVVPYIPEEKLIRSIPGDQYPVAGIHPSFKLEQARPNDFQPKVGGIDFLSDGRMVVSTWDSIGGVYLVNNVQSGNPDEMSYSRIASGLAEPLGLKVVDDEIYVLQKQELTKLVDLDGDDIIDRYETICDDWKVSANFHEFAFGLAYKDGFFYGTLATAILPGGASAKPQIPDRGKVIKIAKDGSSFSFVSHGLRTPNGIGLGYNNEVYIADNQGDWLPSSKIVRAREGAFHGSRSVDFEGTEGVVPDPPIVWLPQDEIGNSPSTPLSLNVGPFQNQMIHGEVTHGGVKRVFVEEVEGVYQGSLFRFTQGLEAGVNRMAWGPDGSLYIGGIGSSGNWQHSGTQWFGLQRLTFEENRSFEMLEVRSKSSGFEIEFTQPISSLARLSPEDFQVEQWYYLPTENYGGPKMDQETLSIDEMKISENRKTLYLDLPGLKEGHVVYIRIKNPFTSENNTELWTTETWYTLNKISSDETTLTTPIELVTDNTLTEAEKAEGFELLFDGKSIDAHFRNFNKEGVNPQWVVHENAIHMKERGGDDLITREKYKNFELRMDWKVQKAGNSGLMYFVNEGENWNEPYSTGPEMQILDNLYHPDGRIEMHRSGDLYDMISCKFVTANGGEEWNRIRLVINNNHVEHWQNGYKVVEFNVGDEGWKEMIAKSKFKDWEGFGAFSEGHIAVQDHSDKVWFKNIRIKKLD